ncbi:hypothetical protein RvY_01231-1 [Ramazzottius varieornatus]|uniref:DDE Tnp4 domain-containing protein n=1 Tax=Ramazzottius varieornatus TaxID=947166 RepID=A0A1D1UFJ7_RAMVA|nr:hypothetical protein RvY_01231-1 [Ramazzottius varieornatus]
MELLVPSAAQSSTNDKCSVVINVFIAQNGSPWFFPMVGCEEIWIIFGSKLQAYTHSQSVHAIKSPHFLAGLILNLYGGQRGSMHDSRLLNESKILEELHEKQAGFVRKYVLYGDSGYAKKNGILHKSHSRIEIRLSKAKDQNTLMSKLRQSVEWCFKEVVTKFAFVDFRKQMKLYEKPVNRIYRVAVLLTNCHNCLYPNQTSRYFDLEPPSLFEYLSCSQED